MNGAASRIAPFLFCFAVQQEAKPFLKRVRGRDDVRCLITGMGTKNAESALRGALKDFLPQSVLTCGFAGALHPDLQIGDVVCSHEPWSPNAKKVQFTCTERVATTVAEKAILRNRTGADVVEMESAIITRVCHELGLPCRTVRVISDTAHEDLPLDFNALMTEEKKLSAWKLAWAIARSPQRIPALMRLGKNSALASERLADVLVAGLALSAEQLQISA